MLEHTRCTNFHFWVCMSPLVAWFFNAGCKLTFENRQNLAKIVYFQSNTWAKARSCRITKCLSMLELELWFSSMLDPTQYSNFHFRTCPSPLNTRFFHTRCNTSDLYLLILTEAFYYFWGIRLQSFQSPSC